MRCPKRREPSQCCSDGTQAQPRSPAFLRRSSSLQRIRPTPPTPYIREDCRQPDIGIGVTGTSLGAFYAANFALKHPETFRYALCMSGRYDISWLTDGHNSDAVYYNNPMAYVPNLEGAELDRVRDNTHLVLVCGRGQWEDGNIEDTEALAEVLERKGISHLRDMWGHDVSHSWSWWKRQARHHLAAYLPPPP